jgi:hypothetical protein
MAVTPYRVRVTQPGAAPGWLRTGTGERMLQTFGLMIDCRMERLAQGMLAHMPRGTVAGTATFTFADGNNASFDYTVNGISQTKLITRQVFVPNGTACR